MREIFNWTGLQDLQDAQENGRLKTSQHILKIL